MNLKSVLGAIAITAVVASADFYSFDCITNSIAGDASIGKEQLSLVVTEIDDKVLFTFTNIGPKASSITDIYFIENMPFELNFQSFTPSTGVDFGVGANPDHLPGFDPTFSVYSFDSENPRQPNGINPTETLGMTFSYANGNTFESIISKLNSSEVKVGIHVQGFATGGSESFISTPTKSVPEPSILTLLGLSLLGVGFIRRRAK